MDDHQDNNFLSELEELSKEIKIDSKPKTNNTDNYANYHSNNSTTINNNDKLIGVEANNNTHIINKDTIKEHNKEEGSDIDATLHNAMEKLEVNLQKVSDLLQNQINMIENNNVSQNIKNEGLNPFTEAFENSMKNENFNFDFLNQDIPFNDMHNMYTENMNMDNKENLSEEKQKEMCMEVLNFLLSTNLLVDVTQNMKKTIIDSYNKNKGKLTEKDETNFHTAIKYADEIIEETQKTTPNKDHIVDLLYNLQLITDVDVFTQMKV